MFFKLIRGVLQGLSSPAISTLLSGTCIIQSNDLELYRGKSFKKMQIIISPYRSRFQKIKIEFGAHYMHSITYRDRGGFWWDLGFEKAKTGSFQTAQQSLKSDAEKASFGFDKRHNSGFALFLKFAGKIFIYGKT